jgi:hypothetical protein
MPGSIAELVVTMRAETASFAADLTKIGNLSTTSAKQIQASFAQVSTTAAGMGASMAQMATQAAGSSSMASNAITMFAANMAAQAGSIKGWMNKIALSVAAMGVAVAAVGIAFLESGITMAAGMGHAAEKAGVTAEVMSALAFAAKNVHIDIETLGMGMARLAKNASLAADGTALPLKAFNRLKVSVTDTTGQLRPMSDLLLDLAAKFKVMPDSTEKTALAMAIFGRAGMQLIPFLNLGRQGIKQFMDQAIDLGIVLSDEMAKKAILAEQAFMRLHARSTALSLSLASELLPVLAVLTKQLDTMQRSGATVHILSDAFAVLAISIEAVVATIRQLIILIKAVPDAGLMLFSDAAAERLSEAHREFDQIHSDFEKFLDDIAGAKLQHVGLDFSIGGADKITSFLENLPLAQFEKLEADAKRAGISIEAMASRMMAATGIEHDATEKLDKLGKAIEALEIKLREEAAGLIHGKEAVELWKLAHLGASEAVLLHFRQLQMWVVATAAAHAPLSKMVKLTDDMTAAIKRQIEEEKKRRAEEEKSKMEGLLGAATGAMPVADAGKALGGLDLRFDDLVTAKGRIEAADAALRQFKTDFDWLAKEMTLANDPMLAFTKGAKELKDMLDQNMISTRIYNIELGNLKDRLGIVQNAADILRPILRSLKTEMGRAFEEAIFQGKKFTEVLAGIFDALGKMLLRMALFGKSGTGGLFGSLFGFFGGLFGGGGGTVPFSAIGVQHGGAVAGGHPYVVGEAGPELFIPRSSGMIIPNDIFRSTSPAEFSSRMERVLARASGGPAWAGSSYLVGEAGPEIFVPMGLSDAQPTERGSATVIYQIDARGATPGMEQRIRQALEQTENRAVQRAVVAQREMSLRNR